jgi:hypothetical protein
MDDGKKNNTIQITINIPVALKERICESAARNCRSMTKEIVFRLLTSFVGRDELNEDLLSFLEKLMERKKQCSVKKID